MSEPSSGPPSGPLPPSVVELPGPFEHQLIHTRGVRLHAAVAGRPTDPLVLLVHDAFGGWFDWLEVIAPLAGAGYHVAAVDLRGYGMSDKPPAGAGSLLRQICSDLTGAIGALGHDEAILVGADTGGSIAWTLATTHPEHVRALVSVSAAHPDDLRRSVAARPWNFFWMGLRGLVSRLPVRLLTASQGVIDDAHRRFLQVNTTPTFQRSTEFARLLDLRLKAARIGNTRPAAVHTARLLLSPVPRRMMNAKVTAPTLLIHPDQELWRHVNTRAEARVSARVDTAVVPGSKTMPHVETPAQFTDVVAGFLAGL